MNLLVTGGAGFIGSNFVRYWLDAHSGDHVVAFDLLTYAGNRSTLDDQFALHGDRLTFRQGDIGNTDHVEELLRNFKIDVIVNFAAESHNSLALLDPARFMRTNGLGTQGLCEAARRAGVARLHHVSTCEVYGDLPLDDDAVAFTEESPYQPRTPYNAAKAAGDHAVRAYHETFGVPISITNCANNYGPYQFPEKVIPLFATLALDDQPLTMYESNDNRREWIHAIDHCHAIDLVINKGRNGETYHVGTGDELSVRQITDLVLSELGKPESLVKIVPDRPGHDRRYLLNTDKIRRELGWAPKVPTEQGIRDTIRWYGENRAWWEPLRKRAPVVESSWQGDPAGARR